MAEILGNKADRLGQVPAHRLNDEHRAAIEAFKAARSQDIFGPFVPLLWSPEVMVRARELGDYLRYKSALPPRLSELLILMTARHWTQQYEWSLHHPIAIKAGVDRAIAEAIAAGRRPSPMTNDQEVLYDFCTELIQDKTVSEATYARALSTFGEKGIIDAISIIGYYSMMAMVLNTACTPPEPGGPTLKPLPQP